MFDVPRKLLSCADCGTQILRSQFDNIDYHRQYFLVNDGSTSFASFCGECISKEWTTARLAAFNAQCQHGWQRHTYLGWSPDGIAITTPVGTHLSFKEVI